MLVARLIPLSLLALALPASAQAAQQHVDGARSELSPLLAELTRPALEDASPAQQADVVGVPDRGTGGLQYVGGRIVVDVRTAGQVGPHLDELERAGAHLVAAGSDGVATVSVDPSDLNSVAAVPGVGAVTQATGPATNTFGGSGLCQGAHTSGAETQLKAFLARNHYGVDGTGLKVGVISDSFAKQTTPSKVSSTATIDLANGDLPGPGDLCGHTTATNVAHESTDVNATDEGRAMVQLVHDLAPGAELLFSTAGTSSTTMAQNIKDLYDAGARVIVDDVTFFDEPMFQDGVISAAVNDVTSRNPPALYLTSASNSATIVGGNDIGSWASTAFRDAATCPAGVPVSLTHCEGFNAAGTDNTLSFTVPANTRMFVALSWAQPQGTGPTGVTTDLDAYILSGSTVVSNNALLLNNVSTGMSNEYNFVDNNTSAPVAYNLAIARNQTTGDASTPPIKLVFWRHPTALEYPTSSGNDTVGPAIFGHNGAQSAISVAAVPVDDSSDPEPYTSRGPIQLYFAPVSGSTPAAALPGAPVTVNKPDIAASDCAANSIFDGTFCGTSAAAPHAAAVVALMKQAVPGATPAQILTALKSTAHAVGTAGPLVVGSGLIDADAALGALGATPNPTGLTPSPILNTSGTIAAGDPTANRVTRSGGAFRQTTCSSVPTQASTAGTFRYDTYNLTNLTDQAQCIKVETTQTASCPTANNLYSTLYTPTCNSANPIGGLVGAAGNSYSLAAPFGYLGSVPANASFTALVQETVSGSSSPAPYSITVDSLAPFGTAKPTVSASPQATVAATTTAGTWTGTPALTYQWRKCDAGGAACSDIAGATTTAYTPAAGDIGSTLRAVVRATVGSQSSTMTTDPSAAVIAAPVAPSNPGSTGGATSTTPTNTIVTVPPVFRDVLAPNTKLTSGPAARTTSRSARFKFSATEAGSRFFCKLDKGKAARCTSPKSYSALKLGKHTFAVFAVDRAGNADKTPAVKKWTVKAKPKAKKRK